MSETKLKEAQSHVREAQKCDCILIGEYTWDSLKTGLLKWKPDYEGACYEYSKAAIAFKNAKAFIECVDCHVKQAELEKSHGSLYQAARALEAAGMVHKEQSDWQAAYQRFNEASDLYLESGTGQSGVIMLTRCAKILESNLPDKAILLYRKAADAAEAEDTLKECAESIGRAGRLYLKIGNLGEAAKCVQRELDCMNKTNHAGVLNKTVMALVLIHLHRDDFAAADAAMQKALKSYTGFYDSEEAGPIERFLHLWSEGEEEAAVAICRGPMFAHIENEFAKLARDLKYPPRKEKVKEKKKKEKMAQAGGGEEEEEEYEDGLL